MAHTCMSQEQVWNQQGLGWLLLCVPCIHTQLYVYADMSVRVACAASLGVIASSSNPRSGA